MDSITLPSPLPWFKQPDFTFKVSKTRPEHPFLYSSAEDKILYHCTAIKKKNTYTVSIMFTTGAVEHTCTCTNEQQGWMHAYLGAYILSYEGVEGPTLMPWVENLEIIDPLAASAWILQHISSKNPVLKVLATRAHKTLLALEDSCTESNKKSKR